MGLRERKRQRTHDTVSAAAITLFLERGYDNVSVADIAAAAEISKPTLFRYFRSKEDLVLHRIADHQGELARVVRERGDRSPLTALRDHFLDGLEQRDPVTGLNDHPEVLAYHQMVFEVPSLSARVNTYAELDEQALAIALSEGETDELMARLAAAQITAVRRVLARENWRRLSEGESATQAYASARAAAERAFTALDSGLGVEIGGSASTSRYG